MSQNAEIPLSFQDGGQVKFKDFYKKYHGGLLKFVNEWITNDAGLVVNDVMLKIYESPDKFESEGHAKNYAYKMIYHRCINITKPKKRSLLLVELALLNDEIADSAVETIHYAEVLNRIRMKIVDLPQLEQQVIYMHMEEKTNDEIALALSIRKSYVATLKNRAIDTLKKTCEEYTQIYHRINNTMAFILLAMFFPFGHHSLFDLIKKIISHFL